MIPVRIIGFRGVKSLNEALNASQQQDAIYAAGGDAHHDGIKFSDHVFPEPGSTGHDTELEGRKSSGYAHTGIHDPNFTTLVPFKGIPEPDRYSEIIDLLHKDGYTYVDYASNLARNPETKRETKIGKWLGKKKLTDLQKVHEKNVTGISSGIMVNPGGGDASNHANKIADNYHVRVSRHPHEVYGMSADDHPWSVGWEHGMGVHGNNNNDGPRYTVVEDNDGDEGHVYDPFHHKISEQMYDSYGWESEAQQHANENHPIEEHPHETHTDGDDEGEPKWHIPNHPSLGGETYDDESDAQDALDSWAEGNYYHEPAPRYQVYDEHGQEFTGEYHHDEDEAQEEADDMNNEDDDDVLGQGSCLSVSGGCYNNHLRGEVSAGTHVAYLHHKGDKDFDTPLARIALRPYQSSETDHKIIRPSTSKSGFAANHGMNEYREEGLDHSEHTNDEFPDSFNPDELEKVTPTMLSSMKTWAKANFKTEAGYHHYRMMDGPYRGDEDGYGGGVPAKLTPQWFSSLDQDRKKDILANAGPTMPHAFVKALVKSEESPAIIAAALDNQGHHVVLDSKVMKHLRGFTGKDKDEINAALAAHLRDYGSEQRSYPGVEDSDIQELLKSDHPRVILGLTSSGKAAKAHDIYGDPQVDTEDLTPDDAEKQSSDNAKEDQEHEQAVRPVIGMIPGTLQNRPSNDPRRTAKKGKGGYANNGALKKYASAIKDKHTEMAEKHPDIVGSSAYGYHEGFLDSSKKYANHILSNHNILTPDHLRVLTSRLGGKELADVHMGKTKLKMDGLPVDMKQDRSSIMAQGALGDHLHAYPYLDQSTLDSIATDKDIGWMRHHSYEPIIDPSKEELAQLATLHKIDKSGFMSAKLSDRHDRLLRSGLAAKTFTQDDVRDSIQTYSDHIASLDTTSSDAVKAASVGLKTPVALSDGSLDDSSPDGKASLDKLKDHFYSSVGAYMKSATEKHPILPNILGRGSSWDRSYGDLSLNTSTSEMAKHMLDKGDLDTVANIIGHDMARHAIARSQVSQEATDNIIAHMQSDSDQSVWASNDRSIKLHNDAQKSAFSKLLDGGKGGKTALNTALDSGDDALRQRAISSASTGTLTDHLASNATGHRLNYKAPSDAHLSVLKELNSRDSSLDHDGSTIGGWHPGLVEGSRGHQDIHPDLKKFMSDPNPQHVSPQSVGAINSNGTSVLSASFFKRAMTEPIKKGEESKIENIVEGVSKLHSDEKKDVVNYVRSLPHHKDNIKNWSRTFPSYPDQFATSSDLNQLVDEGHYDDKPHDLMMHSSLDHGPKNLSSLTNLHSRLSKEEGGNKSAADAISNYALHHVIGDAETAIKWPQDQASTKWLHNEAVKNSKPASEGGINPARLLSNPHMDKGMATQIGGMMASHGLGDYEARDHEIIARSTPEHPDHAYFPKTPQGWDTFMEHSSDPMKIAAIGSHLKGADETHIGSLLDHAIATESDAPASRIGKLTPHLNAAQTSKAANALMARGGFTQPLGNMLKEDSPASKKTQEGILDHIKQATSTHGGAVSNFMNQHAGDLSHDHLGKLIDHMHGEGASYSLSKAHDSFVRRAGPDDAPLVHKITKHAGNYDRSSKLQSYMKHDNGDVKMDNLRSFSSIAPHNIPSGMAIPSSLIGDHIGHLETAVKDDLETGHHPDAGPSDLVKNFHKLPAVRDAVKPEHADRLADLAYKIGLQPRSMLMSRMSPNKVVAHFHNNSVSTSEDRSRLESALAHNKSITPDHVKDIIRHVTDNADDHMGMIQRMSSYLKGQPDKLGPLIDHIKQLPHDSAKLQMSILAATDHSAPASVIDHIIDNHDDFTSFHKSYVSNPNVTEDHFTKMHKKDRASAISLAASHPTLADSPKVRSMLKLDNPAHVREELSSTSFRNFHVAEALGSNKDVAHHNIMQAKTPEATAGFIKGLTTRKDVDDPVEHAGNISVAMAKANPNHLKAQVVKDVVRDHASKYYIKHAPAEKLKDIVHAPSNFVSDLVNAHTLTANMDLLKKPDHPLHHLHPNQVAANVVKLREGRAKLNAMSKDDTIPVATLDQHLKSNITPYGKHRAEAHLLPKQSIKLLNIGKGPDGDASPAWILKNPHHTPKHVDQAADLVSRQDPSDRIAHATIVRMSKSKHLLPYHVDKLLGADHKHSEYHENIAHHIPMTEPQWDKLGSKIDISPRAYKDNPTTPTKTLKSKGLTSEHPSHPSWGDKSFVASATRINWPATKEAILKHHPHMAGNLDHL